MTLELAPASTSTTLVSSEEAQQPVPAKAGGRSPPKSGHLLNTVACPPWLGVCWDSPGMTIPQLN